MDTWQFEARGREGLLSESDGRPAFLSPCHHLLTWLLSAQWPLVKWDHDFCHVCRWVSWGRTRSHIQEVTVDMVNPCANVRESYKWEFLHFILSHHKVIRFLWATSSLEWIFTCHHPSCFSSVWADFTKFSKVSLRLDFSELRIIKLHFP